MLFYEGDKVWWTGEEKYGVLAKESIVGGAGRARDGRFWYPLTTAQPATKITAVSLTLDHEVPEDELVKWREDPERAASAVRVAAYKQAAREPARRLARRQQMASLEQEMTHNRETIYLLAAQNREMSQTYEELRREEQFLDLDGDYDTEKFWVENTGL